MADHREIEARWIKLEMKDVLARLKKIGAKKVGSYFFREWVFAKPEWRAANRRLRVRTDGKQTWLTYKSSVSWAVDGTEEIEVTVSSADDLVKMLQSSDLPLLRYQEKKRESFHIGEIAFDLDTWPKIPLVVEIEAPSEEQVREGAALLGLEWKDAIFKDQAFVHSEYYGIDLFKMNEYRFES